MSFQSKVYSSLGMSVVLLFTSTFSANAAVSAFSRSNCYVPLADIGWESITWGWPSSMRATSSWQKIVGEPAYTAVNLTDEFRETWRSFAGTSHGSSNDTWEVKGKHWWAQTEPFNGLYNYKNSYAIDCNLSEW